ncbi:OmpA family protein [Phycicoccus sp. BSK3Z-2]|uniref:OmpA family protein n=1 Tax=Phycicoccus avicenniae TaxID=2828860 RepID=A0A941DA30_9MICO|nr:OmpA family protein [Phycicoccus avicenniae]MBR7744879.1 OmpA family protein [Phycicoccus avicenniae]
MTRGTTSVLAAGAAAVLAAVVVAPASRAADPGDLEIPVRGQVVTLGSQRGGTPGVVTVHRVARTEDATVVYWSFGVPEGAEGGNGNPLGGSTTAFYDSLTGPQIGDVGLVDAAAGLVYRPLVADDGSGRCVCPANQALYGLEPGQAGVLWAGVAPLPADVTTVDVVIAEQVLPDVPVEEGLLEPVAEDQDLPLVLGTGWPDIPADELADAASLDPAAFEITERVANLEQSVTTSQEEVDLAADVLFAKDSARLTRRAASTIREAAATIRDSAPEGTRLTVVGHTDSDASASYNDRLSRQRAEAVATALGRELGADYTLRTEGRGESEPIADNRSESGKAKNRRVTVSFGNGG